MQEQENIVVGVEWVRENLQDYPVAWRLDGELWLLQSRDKPPFFEASRRESCRRVHPAAESVVTELLSKAGRGIEARHSMP